MKTLSLFLSALLTLLLLSAVQAQEEYLTVEERNKQAMEDMRKMAEEMRRLAEQQQKGEPAPAPQKDYSQYHWVADFKNVFGGLSYNHVYGDKAGVWQRHERDRHIEAVQHIDYDLIVLPVQDFSGGNDAISRLLSAQYLAAEIAEAKGNNVLEPELIMRIAGENNLLFDDSLVMGLAEGRKSKVVHLYLKILSGFYGSDDDAPYYELAVVLSDWAGKVLGYSTHRFGTTGLKEPLEVKVRAVLPDILSQLKLEEEKTRQQVASMSSGNPAPVSSGKIAGSFDMIADRAQTPVDQAAWLQFLALLTPETFLSERNHLFSRSLVALRLEKETDPRVGALQARALHYLHRRPVGLAYVAESRAPEAVAVREYLNGNYPPLKEALSRIESPLFYCLSYLELFKLSASYGKSLPEVDTGKIEGGWRTLLVHATRSNTAWYSFDAADLFAAMNEILPDSERVFGDAAASFFPGDIESSDMQTTMYQSLITELDQRAVADPASLYGQRAVRADVWGLFRNLCVEKLLQQFDRITWLQGRYDDGLAFGDKLAAVLGGLPRFSYRYAMGAAAVARRQPRYKKQYYYRMSFESACEVWRHAVVADDFRQSAIDLIKDIKETGYTGEDLCNYRLWVERMPSSSKSYKYAVDDVSSLLKHLTKSTPDDSRRVYEKILFARFEGHPERLKYECRKMWDSGAKEEAVAHLWKAIRRDQQRLDVYSLLGDYLLELGDYMGASDAFFSFSYFQDVPSSERVGFSHTVYNFGKKFLSYGRTKEAIPFLRFCVSLGTGSGSEAQARYMLSVLEKDYRSAAEASLGQWQHYGNISALARYAQMSALLGEGDYAGKTLESVLKSDRTIDNGDRRELLDAFVTILKGRASESFDPVTSLKDFLAPGKAAGFDEESHLAVYTLASVDREFSIEMENTLKETAPKVNQLTNRYPGLNRIFGQKAKEKVDGAQSAQPGKDRPLLVSTESSDVYHVLRLVRDSRYDEAVATLLKQEESGQSHPFFGYSEYALFALPYALTAIIPSSYSSGEKLSQLVDLKRQWKGVKIDRYDDHLVYCLVAAAKKDMPEALQQLRAARKKLYAAGTELRWYQFLAIAEWLHAASGDRQFLETALEAAEHLCLTHPSSSWAHAFVALYGRDDARRIEAAGFALQLDPSSRWLTEVPPGIKEKGQAQYAATILRRKGPEPIREDT